ncbi:hypothetical protein SAMN05443248_4072 [Bradyrhizobium erythrophlei]|uniref:Uncharacterized protein n=1 Tax=Bradyrhizobium erythrophlei TaxID=1437360 RepID=A0A1M5R463_9BRAD|nr:hypothetical protein SAMN05443248_4072 [Bradyrhizobium erythrophlei]
MWSTVSARSGALRKAGARHGLLPVPLPKLQVDALEPGGLRDRTEADHLNKCPVCGALLACAI